MWELPKELLSITEPYPTQSPSPAHTRPPVPQRSSATLHPVPNCQLQALINMSKQSSASPRSYPRISPHIRLPLLLSFLNHAFLSLPPACSSPATQLYKAILVINSFPFASGSFQELSAVSLPLTSALPTLWDVVGPPCPSGILHDSRCSRDPRASQCTPPSLLI